MVAYADLVLPDTTYLERFDAISLLDRPISDADGAADAIRHPVFDLHAGAEAAGRDVRGFQSVLLDLGARLRPAGHGARRRQRRATATTPTTSSATSARPGVGLLAGWRGADGAQHRQGRAESRPAATLHRQRRFLARRRSRVRALLQDGQPRLPASGRTKLGFVAIADADRAAAVLARRCRNSGWRAGPRRRCSRPRPQRERVATLLRSAADLVRAVRRRAARLPATIRCRR